MRLFFGLPIAAAITAALFVIMSAMIRQEARIDPPVETPNIQILGEIKPTTPTPTRVNPRTIDEDPPEIMTRETIRPGKPVPVDIGPGPGSGVEGISEGAPIGGVRPIIKIPPAYPEQCRSAGAEGSVIVQFDVTDKGEVVNARIISSDHRCFDRAVIKAVSGWKYPAERRTGVTETVTFRLEE